MISEEELIERCKNKDQSAQKVLFERYANKMMAVCMRYCKNQEDARDLLHDGFYKVFIKIDSFRGGSRIDTWMTRLFINLALNKLRHGRNKYYHDEFEAKHETFTSSDETTSSAYKVEPNQVLDALNQLPDIYKIVLNMYAIDNMSHKEIAAELKISIGSSKSRLSRARVLLNAKLKRK
ncbi:MAG: RNA polymerase sigma factor [Bacteroidia bacterium]|nr:RNA polymerase sigma factor [Bacteroidia bacterium]NNJ56502.1 RNA polymerase sigma factor [Bacteroidia bacterium]